ncbi:hypothetical protein SCHPADRAFT_927776 [Schizopora paradoxa]|uniref:Cyclin N-terminal domain-containing protein n=1 Tax=Schizopora paradoxa TaxID=27342 RepID=A0A0H2RS12_9AGAM|nr:hypothetical protein SCHPADRAFT_927776 [Schizopora paradoxa]
MQTLQQTMSHRGAGMTRTHARWHPYTPPRTSASNTPNYVHRSVPTPSSAVGSTSQHDASYLITPASSVYSISPASSFSSSPHASSSAPALLKTIPGAKPPTSSKPPFVASLVEQSVKSLTEIWRPEYVPPVFCTSTQVSLADSTNPPSITSNARRSTLSRKPTLQLPSPCSPSTQPSPPSYSGLAQATAFFGEQIGDGTVVTEKELVPIRIYVHEVLRRSRTTCSVLQSALCYIEAIRKKIPELAELEKSGKANRGDFVIEDRIEVGDESLQSETSSSLSDCPTETMSTETIVPDSVQTVTQDQTSTAQTENDGGLKKRKGPSKPLPPLPPLPSPLLCPRRAFLAALILASKFLQDRCYSNRAWAKLSGLAPREVSRCERALGEALEWRLWVGKSAVSSEFSGRSLARARSESTINVGSPVASEASHYQIPSPPLTDDGASPEIRSSAASFTPQENMRRVGFGRSQTLPDILANHYGRAAPPPPLVLPPPACAGTNISMQKHFTAANSYTPSHTSKLCSEVSSMDAADIPTPRLSYSPQSLVEPNLDTPSTQYSAAWSPARSIGSNDSSDGSSPPNYIGAYASFSSLDTKVAECMSWRRQHANNAASFHGFDMMTAAAAGPMLHFGAPSMLDFAPQATGIPSFGQA